MSSKSLRIVLKGITLCLLFTTIALAQPKDWDDVSREELEMQVYPSDSSAAAVVLFDKAEVDFNKKLEYVMERHVRVKILREEGYKWAEEEIIYSEEYDQEISRIRGHTFVLDRNGKVRKHKLDKDSIFEEDLAEDYKRIKFTLPALKPGAVFEYKYRFYIGSPHLLPDWEFQKAIPVAWSEYNVKIPDWFFYNKMFVGNHTLHINKSEPFSDRMRFTLKERTGFYTVKTKYHNAYIDIDGTENQWVMKDLPAVEELPFMTSVDDYTSKLWLQLTEIHIPRQPPRYFLKTWSDVAKELRELDSFGGRLRSRPEFRAVVNDVTTGLVDPLEKMEAIYHYVIESIVWEGSHGIFAEDNLSEVLKSKKGNSVELNLLLVQLLREAGLQANPVVLSTREHGKVFDILAIANQFNHVIANIKIGDKSYLLDATSDDSSVNILPKKDLNGNGLLVSNEGEEWIELKSRIATKSKVTFNAIITDKGKINGDLYVDLQGYDASEVLSELTEKGHNNFIDDVYQKHFSSGAVDSFHVKAEKFTKSELDYSLSVSNTTPIEIQQAGDRLYFNPMIFLREKENPFSQPERKIPVDFPYLFEKEFIANFVVPEGYSVEEIPEPKVIALPGGTAEIRRLTEVVENRISVLSKFRIKKKTFRPEEYKYLRAFYRHIVGLHSEQIVLKSDLNSN